LLQRGIEHSTTPQQTWSNDNQEIVEQETYVVTTAGRPSGIAATARATATCEKKNNRWYIL